MYWQLAYVCWKCVIIKRKRYSDRLDIGLRNYVNFCLAIITKLHLLPALVILSITLL